MYDEDEWLEPAGLDYFEADDAAMEPRWRMDIAGKHYGYWIDKDGYKLTNLGYIIAPDNTAYNAL